MTVCALSSPIGRMAGGAALKAGFAWSDAQEPSFAS